MVQQIPVGKGITLGRGVYKLLQKVDSFQDQIAGIKTDLRDLGDRLEEQLQVYTIQPPSKNVPLLCSEAFPLLQILNSLERLTLDMDKTPKQHEAQFRQCQKDLKEKCSSILTNKPQDWQSDFAAVCLPFKEELTSATGMQERVQRYQQIGQLRLKCLEFDWGMEATATPNTIEPSSQEEHNVVS